MRIAETVTFGGSAFDRAAQLRTRPDAIAALLADEAARVLPLWRGKPLVAGTDQVGLGWIAADAPLWRDAAEAPVFLGRDAAGPRFARDLSGWEPDEMPETLGAFHDPSEQHHPELPGDHRFVELRATMTVLDARDAELAATARAILEWHRTHRFCARCGAPSDTALAGWQRVCPACSGHHFPRTDPVVIMLVRAGNDVLLGRSPGWPEGMYSLLAGFVEPGETIEAAVRREVFEEAGIRIGPVRYLASQPWPFPASLMIGCEGIALSRQISIDPVEIEDAIWVSREEMLDIFAGRHDRIRAARSGAIAHFLLRNWLADRLD